MSICSILLDTFSVLGISEALLKHYPMNIVKGIKPLSLSPSLGFLKHYVSLQHNDEWIMFYLGTMANGQHACVLYDNCKSISWQGHDTRLNILFNDDGLMECNISVNWEDFTMFSNMKYFIFQSKRIINLITGQ